MQFINFSKKLNSFSILRNYPAITASHHTSHGLTIYTYTHKLTTQIGSLSIVSHLSFPIKPSVHVQMCRVLAIRNRVMPKRKVFSSVI